MTVSQLRRPALLLLLGLTALAALPATAASRSLRASDQWCCTVARPCWGWGPEEGRCCHSPDGNGGTDCIPAKACVNGTKPDTYNARCGALNSTSPLPSPSPSSPTTDEKILAAAQSALASGSDPAKAWITALRAAIAASALLSPDTPANARLLAAEKALAAGLDPAAAWLAAGGGAAAAGQEVQNSTLGGLYSTYHYYESKDTNGIYCQDVFSAKSASEGAAFAKTLLIHPWTAYCAANSTIGPMSQDQCGRCISVTNPASGKNVTLLIADKCGQGGLDVDKVAFDQLDDATQDGYKRGSMGLVINGYVDC